MLAVHTETPPTTKYESCLEPGYVFDPKGELKFKHSAQIPPDDNSPISFRWHFPASTLKPRMSGLELATFLMGHMPAIIGCGLLRDHPRIHREFCRIWMLFQATPQAMLDEILPWVQSVDRRVPRKVADALGIPRVEEDDIIVLDLNIKYVPERKARVFY